MSLASNDQMCKCLIDGSNDANDDWQTPFACQAKPRMSNVSDNIINARETQCKNRNNLDKNTSVWNIIALH